MAHDYRDIVLLPACSLLDGALFDKCDESDAFLIKTCDVCSSGSLFSKNMTQTYSQYIGQHIAWKLLCEPEPKSAFDKKLV